HPIGTLTTLVLPHGQRGRRGRPPRSASAGVEIRCGSQEVIDDIVACLTRSGQRHQFAPCWQAEDLLGNDRTPNLQPEQFTIATRAGRVIGCVACWDQRPFKQVVVRGYAPRLAAFLPIVNIASPWLGMPRLPAPGQRLEFVYLSHLAIDEDDGQVARALVG